MKQYKIKQLVRHIRDGFAAAGLVSMSLLAANAAAAPVAEGPLATAAGQPDQAADPATEVVTVTARKTNELVQDVPMSISIVRADQMIKDNTNNIRDYFAKIPGLNVGRAAGRTDVSLRGITTGTNSNPTTAIVIDDAPFGSSTSLGGGSLMMPDLDPFDLQRIEVLRGPQGTLYGASNLGGLIKYVTLAPNTSVLSGKVQVDGSSVAHGAEGYGMRGAINIPLISDELAMRVSVFKRQDPGWIDNMTTGEKDVNSVAVQGGRLSVLWKPNSKLTLRSSGLYQYSEGHGTTGEAITPALVPAYGEYIGAVMPNSSTYRRTINFYDLSVTADLDWATLVSTSSYGRMDFQGPQDLSWVFGGLLENIFHAPFGALGTSPMSVHKKTQEFRLDSPEGNSRIDWRLGLFYTNEDSAGGQKITANDRKTGQQIPGLPVLIDSKTQGTFEEYAVYGMLTYHFSEAFDVQGGLRYSKNRQETSAHDTGILKGNTPDTAGSSRESKSTYMITPRYKVSPELMLYATLSTGYRPGGPNNALASNIPRSYASDTTRNVELGVKGQYFDKRLALDAALFNIDWKNLQVLLLDPSTNFGYTANAGDARSQGLELSAALYPAQGWSMTGNAVLTRAVLTSSTGSTSNGNAGDRLPYSAPLTGALSINRDFGIGNGWTASGGLSSAYVGDRYMSFGNTPQSVRYHWPGYATFALQAGLRNKVWSINAFVKNAGDKRGIQSGGLSDQIAPSRIFKNPEGSIATITPRTIGMSVSRSF